MTIEAVLAERPADMTIRDLAEHAMPWSDWAGLPPPAMVERARARLQQEADLGNEERREAAYQRLRSWLDLDGESARVVARAFDDAAASFPAAEQRQRIEVESDALLRGFSFADFRRLAGLVPWVASDDGVRAIGRAAMLALPRAS